MINEMIVARRIDELTKERDAYLVQANQQLAAYNAVIAELERMLKPEPVTEQGDTNA